MAINLAKKGLDVIITYHSNKSAAEEVVSLITGMGQKAIALQLDVSEYTQYEPFFKSLSKSLEEKFKHQPLII